MKATDRLLLSTRTIAGWEQLGVPGGPVVDNLRMIREELAELNRIKAGRADLEEQVVALEARFGAMANRLRLRSN